ncbi:MAG TPA: DUF1801 domain-containing protein [Candidatus Acidoferrales bacterium]|nr:DUF1801 domain-containing protein [Candidatus Acidoferrales bacterium]
MAKTVDAYIKGAPKDAQAKLKQLRSVIRKAAPDSVERISYGMPYYGYKGRLAYFRLAKAHIGLYIPPPIIEQHKKELAAYETAKSTVRLPLDKKLPLALIRKLIVSRARYNESRKKKR